MFRILGPLKTTIILVVFISGLAVILLERTLGPDLPETASVLLRTVFWGGAILYLVMRVSEWRARREADREDSR